MKDQTPREESQPAPHAAPPAPGPESTVPAATGDQRPVTELTAEEQMARFEAALKEEDWGHQPC
jgi:hypothetical protein